VGDAPYDIAARRCGVKTRARAGPSLSAPGTTTRSPAGEVLIPPWKTAGHARAAHDELPSKTRDFANREHRFRRVRKDGELGEEIVFDGAGR
jgi:hypothetical protein